DNHGSTKRSSQLPHRNDQTPEQHTQKNPELIPSRNEHRIHCGNDTAPTRSPEPAPDRSAEAVKGIELAL
ncbi:MAG TPA: hypothetical protein VE155_09265, partial [Pseudonocardiaceae bacterium]|nr:hypothetical protein [Pseudonocardiaceae bacterium]